MPGRCRRLPAEKPRPNAEYLTAATSARAIHLPAGLQPCAHPEPPGDNAEYAQTDEGKFKRFWIFRDWSRKLAGYWAGFRVFVIFEKLLDGENGQE